MAEDALKIVRDIQELFVSRKLLLTVAESCTGGLINHLLTEEPGASRFLDSGLVTYTVESKHRLLDVRRSIIRKHGVISEEAARVMAHGAEELTDSDVALAVTGNAGPDAMEDKEVGLVYVAVTSGEEKASRGFMFDGSRSEIKSKAAVAALTFLYETVSSWKP